MFPLHDESLLVLAALTRLALPCKMPSSESFASLCEESELAGCHVPKSRTFSSACYRATKVKRRRERKRQKEKADGRSSKILVMTAGDPRPRTSSLTTAAVALHSASTVVPDGHPVHGHLERQQRCLSLTAPLFHRSLTAGVLVVRNTDCYFIVLFFPSKPYLSFRLSIHQAVHWMTIHTILLQQK